MCLVVVNNFDRNPKIFYVIFYVLNPDISDQSCTVNGELRAGQKTDVVPRLVGYVVRAYVCMMCYPYVLTHYPYELLVFIRTMRNMHIMHTTRVL